MAFLLHFLVLFAMLALFGQSAVARDIEPGQVGTGSLLLRTTKPGSYVEAPRVATDFTITVNGPIARTQVTQRFENPTDGWVEGVYVFPLPENSAVDVLKMVVGNRVIVGDIKERQEAKQIYETAKAAGQKAALLEQERPNLFTSSVANIGPGDSIVIQIEYQETVRQSAGVFSIRVPMVMGPRYNPAPDLLASSSAEPGVISDPVPDRDSIEPPVLDPRVNAPVNPVTLSVTLNAGFPVTDVKSHHHKITEESTSDDSRIIRLADGVVPADRDFELTWRALASREPSVRLFKETQGTSDYVLGIVSPPQSPQQSGSHPREVIFVIDNSGSMGGPSMDQAKASLLYALSRLSTADRFNVIRFDDTMDMLYPAAVDVTRENIERATRFVSRLEAGGGTEMVAPLRAALVDADQASNTYLRQIVFLTDGAIGNEQEMFDLLALKRGRSRVFMVGIGSAPNSFLMSRMAEIGRGTLTHIGETDQVEERMRELFAKLENPAVTDLKATTDAPSVEITPDTLPDLYQGEPIILLARLPRAEGNMSISGKVGDRRWNATLPLAGAKDGQGIAKLWARRKIESAEVAMSLNEITSDEADRRVLALALEHHLVSRRTSIVAVDKTPDRPRDQRLTRLEVPLNLPAGWDFDKVFGEPVKTRHANADFKAIAMSDLPKTAHQTAAQELTLPQTATPSQLLMMLGSLLLVMAMALQLFSRNGVRS
jgi:Ca-activated chloride channel family protein